MLKPLSLRGYNVIEGKSPESTRLEIEEMGERVEFILDQEISLDAVYEALELFAIKKEQIAKDMEDVFGRLEMSEESKRVLKENIRKLLCELERSTAVDKVQKFWIHVLLSLLQ